MDNNKNSRYIVEQLSELRDLLIVIERSGDTAPDILYKLAIEKSQKITLLIEQRCQAAVPRPVEVPQEYEVWSDEATDDAVVEEPVELSIEELMPQVEEEPAPAEFVIEEPAEETPQCDVHDDMEITIDEEEEYVAPFVEDEIIPQPAVETTPVEEAAPICYFEEDVVEVPAEETAEEPLEEIDVESDEIAMFVEDEVDLEPVADVVVADEADEYVMDESEEIAIIDQDVIIMMDDESEEVGEEESDDENDEESDNSFYNRGEPLDSEPLTVGDMMSMRQARELRKALSLNDRFRFRRELFGNSDINMNDTLNLIDTMSDYNEANEYLMQDLGWSIDEPVVQEFLKLVELHFKQK